MELSFRKKNIGLGRRKEASARVFLLPGEGNITINKKSGDKYFIASNFADNRSQPCKCFAND